MISIIVPTYKEVDNIPELCRRVDAAMSGADLEYELIIVDDNSDDGSEAAANESAANGIPVRIIVRKTERGLASAVVHGFDNASGDLLLCMDADLSHPPEALPRIIECFDDESCDFVIGSRYVSGGGTDDDWGFLRWLNSKVATCLARPFTKAKDPMAGFFCLRKRDYEKAVTAGINPIGYKIGLELMVKAGCNDVREVPIQFAQRHAGESKLTLKEQINYLKHLKTLGDFKYGLLSRLIVFCMVGASGAIVDLGCFKLMRLGGLNLKIARALAIWLAMSWNFVVNRRVTFHDARKYSILRQYISFVAACLLGAVINYIVSVRIAPQISVFENRELLSAAAGIICGTISNFLFSLKMVFVKHER